MVYILTISIFLTFFYVTRAVPQFPEINDQYEQQKHNEAVTVKQDTTTTLQTTTPTSSTINIKVDEIKVEPKEINEAAINNTRKINTSDSQKEINNSTPIIVQRSLGTKLYESITRPIEVFLNEPRVITVIKNIGTCIVNGVMELVAFYLPAPLMPLVASAAGMFIPFEPVVMLKQKMPVASYRRAFRTAMDSFMGTFDRYKVQDEDPYMTNSFNRRFMGNSNGSSKELKDDKDLKEN